MITSQICRVGRGKAETHHYGHRRPAKTKRLHLRGGFHSQTRSTHPTTSTSSPYPSASITRLSIKRTLPTLPATKATALPVTCRFRFVGWVEAKPKPTIMVTGVLLKQSDCIFAVGFTRRLALPTLRLQHLLLIHRHQSHDYQSSARCRLCLRLKRRHYR